jgi:NADPH:quinone reductase-like Zn-dependent oxidoreductase
MRLVAGIQFGSREYFEDMNRFIEEHRIIPVVDREFTFDEALQAFAHMAEQRHSTGDKLILRF